MKLKKQILIPVVVLVAFIAGFFIGDASAVNRIKKEIGSALSTNVNVDKEQTKKDEPKKDEPKQEVKKEETKVLKVGEKYSYKDKYEITINKVTLTDKRNQFSEKKVNKVAVIDFTYKNLALDKDLFISDSNFKVYDEAGNVLETYPAGADKMSQNVAQGKQCTAEMSFGFNDGAKLELDYYDNMFNDKADVKFMLEIQ